MKEDGGPAFPNTITSEPDGAGRLFPAHFGEGGMTLRDYFAAKAMQGIYTQESLFNKFVKTGYSTEAIARAAFEQADAMIKAREQ